MMLQKRERHPTPLPDETTFFPKGQNISAAILKHCKPHGMPTIVRHNTKPPEYITERCKKATKNFRPDDIAEEIHDVKICKLLTSFQLPVPLKHQLL